MADATIWYDSDGKPLQRNARGGFDPHRYQEQLGKCVCGKDRWHPEHFNGDGAAAKVAMEDHRRRNDYIRSWLQGLTVGAPVQVKDDHPSSDLAGMVGNVTAIEREAHKPAIVTVRFKHREVSVKSQWLMPPPLPDKPPKFASQEEADRWLEDTAKEMGIRTEPVVPRFNTPEEADEWMRRQQGEPYVPPGWVPDPDPDGDDARLLKLLQQAIPPGQAIITQGGSLTRATLRNAIKGAQVRGVYYDEAAAITSDDDVIDPYA